MKWDDFTYPGGSNNGVVKGMDCEIPGWRRPWASFPYLCFSLRHISVLNSTYLTGSLERLSEESAQLLVHVIIIIEEF